MAAMVILRHDCPDGTWHLDWMIERDGLPAGADVRALLTFRMGATFPDRAGMTGVGVQIDDHRRAYLNYEGAISGGRGRVQRLARGLAQIGAEVDGMLRIEGSFAGGPPLTWRLEKGAGDEWHVTALARAGACSV